jgi:hypothetical protein
MKVFSPQPKQNQLQSRVLVSLALAKLVTSEQPREVPDLQRAIGNLAIQRNLRSATCLGHDFSRVPSRTRLQTKLTVNTPGDAYEREAHRIARQVMRMPDPQLQRACSCGGACPKCKTTDDQEDREKVQTKRIHETADPVFEAPTLVNEVLRSPGQPLDSPARTFMEARFDRDFARVRVHTGRDAAESAGVMGARAYTVGSHIVFGAGEYAPSGTIGRRLLAHELVHVAQQDGSSGLVQRAEVDDRSCAGLTDIESDIDTLVNTEIASARAAGGTPLAVPAFLADVESRLGGLTPVSPLETFIEGLPATKRSVPPSSLTGTKYKGASAVNRFYLLHTMGAAHVVGSAAKVHSLCVGADKLGHFFQQGFDYFQIATSSGGSQALAEDAGRGWEIKMQGLGSTGVFSNADLAANLAGLQFYKDLKASPSSLTFGIKKYITPKWNEQSNPSFYESSIGTVVWSNLLTGPWLGPFTSAGGTSTPIDSKVALRATSAGSVTGTYEWPAAKPTNKGKIKTGTVTQKTTSVSGITSSMGSLITISDTPVSGVSIDFDWEEGTSAGKGKWDSVDEQTLDGTWGIGSSSTSGGSWKLKKT